MRESFNDVSPYDWNAKSEFGFKHPYGINPVDRRMIDRIKIRAIGVLDTIDKALMGVAASAEDREIEAIEELMRDDFEAYDDDDAMRTRYLELLEAREKRAPKRGTEPARRSNTDDVIYSR